MAAREVEFKAKMDEADVVAPANQLLVDRYDQMVVKHSEECAEVQDVLEEVMNLPAEEIAKMKADYLASHPPEPVDMSEAADAN